MQKAHGCGVLKAMVALVMDQDPGWSIVSGQSNDGAMNDASKRLRETSADKPVKTYATSSELGTMAVPMPSTGYGVKIPKLPPGVGSLEAWGRTKISCGKFKDKRTYSGLTSPFPSFPRVPKIAATSPGWLLATRRDCPNCKIW